MTTWVGNQPIKGWGTAVSHLDDFHRRARINQQNIFFPYFFLFFRSLYKMNSLMTPAEILDLNLNDSALDLLNAAIASHQVKLEDEQDTTEDEGTLSHGKESIYLF